MSSDLNIALIQQADARSVRTWSGTAWFSKRAIEKHLGRVTDLSPYPNSILPWHLRGKLFSSLSGKGYSPDHDPDIARRYGEYFSRKLREGNYDLVFSPAGSASIAWLETDIPIVYFSDATWRVVLDYYACYTNLIPMSRKGGDEIERRALERSRLALFSSDWAARSAIDDYGIDPARVRTVGIAANLIDPPRREEVLKRRLGKTIRLLFIGVSWENKGGAIARDTLIHLLDQGYDAELVVLGCEVPSNMAHPRMRTIRYLDKAIPAQLAEFERLWRESDFFILPTRFEATAIVFCEASAYGLPVLTTDTGGVAAIVHEGTNGFRLPLIAGGAEYASVIKSLVDDPDRYDDLCRSSRDEYDNRLNWDSWGERVADIVRQELGVAVIRE